MIIKVYVVLFVFCVLTGAEELINYKMIKNPKKIEIKVREIIPLDKSQYFNRYWKAEIDQKCFSQLIKNPIDTVKRRKKIENYSRNPNFGYISINGKMLCMFRDSFYDSCKYDPKIRLIFKLQNEDSTAMITYNCEHTQKCFDGLSWKRISITEFERENGDSVIQEFIDSIKSYFPEKHDYDIQELGARDKELDKYYSYRKRKRINALDGAFEQ